ncbi:MAG: hypothetical protein A2086_10380 [Spirochaetes bacterium GWD1_27_9]|nr:MAG: hypothetical protein A2Z98_03595 [Spirochaetes bacterium GWB1_27_13]OHD22955.1 MAG: hypothetical protein A2Y34_00975 [Spirochaetes bacterium GWC1_27_15]OHD43698.1 MAG: hypothetical protein A2086_10380 [Spirochaetes bacterium GWD1_27_9]
MKKYNLKTDLKRIYYIIISVLTILGMFALFSLIFILPIYLVSKYYPAIYNIISLLVIFLIIIFFVIKKIIKIWDKYKKINFLILHIFTFFLLPIFIFFFFILIELVVFRGFYQLLDFILATIFVVVINLILIISILLSRRIFFYLKNHLKKNELVI